MSDVSDIEKVYFALPINGYIMHLESQIKVIWQYSIVTLKLNK